MKDLKKIVKESYEKIANEGCCSLDRDDQKDERIKIQVYGSGCSTCKKLYEIAQKVAAEMGVKDKVEYISGPEGIQKIIDLGALGSPILVVNGKLAMTGFSPDVAKIKSAILKISVGR